MSKWFKYRKWRFFLIKKIIYIYKFNLAPSRFFSKFRQCTLNSIDRRKHRSWVVLMQGDKENKETLLQFASEKENEVINDNFDEWCSGERQSLTNFSWVNPNFELGNKKKVGSKSCSWLQASTLALVVTEKRRTITFQAHIVRPCSFFSALRKGVAPNLMGLRAGPKVKAESRLP